MFLKFGPLYVIFREPRFEIRSHYGTEIILDDPGEYEPPTSEQVANAGQPEPVAVAATMASTPTVALSPRIECNECHECDSGVSTDSDVARWFDRLDELTETRRS